MSRARPGGTAIDADTSAAEIVTTARDHLGAPLATYIVQEPATRTLQRWIDGDSSPDRLVVERLEAAIEIAALLETREGRGTVQVWFQGSNPLLGGRAPAEVLVEDTLDSARAGLRLAALGMLGR